MVDGVPPIDPDVRRAASANNMSKGGAMRNEYDFSSAQRGPILKGARGKTRMTIRVDDDILDWFRGQVHEAGGGSYQAMMNDALRAFMDRTSGRQGGAATR
jgi:uncharacterized protein (DUF4415 family)